MLAAHALSVHHSPFLDRFSVLKVFIEAAFRAWKMCVAYSVDYTALIIPSDPNMYIAEN